jgi:hypothetical protein
MGFVVVAPGDDAPHDGDDDDDEDVGDVGESDEEREEEEVEDSWRGQCTAGGTTAVCLPIRPGRVGERARTQLNDSVVKDLLSEGSKVTACAIPQ